MSIDRTREQSFLLRSLEAANQKKLIGWMFLAFSQQLPARLPMVRENPAE
jgi:hypothetical protein